MISNTKQKGNVKDESGVDRISSLTDDVLCHILSFLPTKYAIGTSALSKRWNNLWTAVPNLDIDDTLLLHQGNLHEEAVQTCFSNFVNKVLSLHKLSCVRKCRLRCTDPAHVYALICDAIMPVVEELDLCIPTFDFFFYSPQTLYYTRSNLLHLKLSYLKIIANDSLAVCLPRLKTLNLSMVDFADDDSLKKLLSGCPVLEDLDIERLGLDNSLTLYVYSTSLERLSIYSNRSINPLNITGNTYNVVVEAPNLKHLVLDARIIENCQLCDLSFLVSASIAHNRGSTVFQLLKNVSNVKKLICSSIDDLWHPRFVNLPVFPNLTHLTVEVFEILLHFLQHSPNLKHMVLGTNCFGWKSPDYVCQCMLVHLETIEIFIIQGCEDEMEMIGYFLKNSMVLKMMRINTSIFLESEEKIPILKKLLMLPKGSRSCRIALH